MDKEEWTQKFASFGVAETDIFREIMRARRLDYILFSNPQNVTYGVTQEDLYAAMKKETEADLGVFPGDVGQYAEVYTMAMRTPPAAYAPQEGLAALPEHGKELLTEAVRKAQQAEKTVLFAGADGYLRAVTDIFQCLSDKNVTVSVFDPAWKERFQYLYPQGRVLTEAELLADTGRYDYIFYLVPEAKADTLDRKSRIMEVWSALTEHISPRGHADAVLPQFFMSHPGKKIDYVRSEVARRCVLSSYHHVVLGESSNYVYLTTGGAEPEGQLTFGEIGFEEGMSVRYDKEKTLRKNLDVTGTWDYDFWVYTESEGLKKLFAAGQLDMSFCIGQVFSAVKGEKNSPCGKGVRISIGDLDGAGIKEDMIGQGGGTEGAAVPVRAGDLLVTVRGSAFKTAVVPDSLDGMAASSNLMVLRPHDMYTAEYLKMYLDSSVGRAFIRAVSTGTTRLNIRPERVLRIPLIKGEKVQIEAITSVCRSAVADYERASRRWREVQHMAETSMGGSQEGMY